MPPRPNSFVSGNGALSETWGSGVEGAEQLWAGVCHCRHLSGSCPLLPPALEIPLSSPERLKNSLSNSGLLEAALHNSGQLPGSPPCP